MTYNLTKQQKDLARWIVGEVRTEKFTESFTVIWLMEGAMIAGTSEASRNGLQVQGLNRGELDALAEAKLLMGTSKNPVFLIFELESSPGIFDKSCFCLG